MTDRLVILGPQRLRPTVDRALAGLGVSGQVAAVTAGWQERESEDQDLGEYLGGRVSNLELYRRAEGVFARDPDFFAAYRERQDRLRDLRELYTRRLDHALAAARELFALEDDSDLVVGEREEAIAAVRDLDRHHLTEIRKIHRVFDRRWRPRRRASVARERDEIAAVLTGVEALAIAGGHVAVLLNRLRLFGVLELLGGKPILAWSAGAMVLGERIVLFHDTPPQGAGNAEVLETGLGLLSGWLPLPHARRRLRLDDPVRVALLARRFAPARCFALDEGDALAHNGSWRAMSPLRLLGEDGAIEHVDGTVA